MAKTGTIFLNLLNISPKKIRAVIAVLKNPQEIFTVKPDVLSKINFLTTQDIKEIITLRKSAILDRELSLINKEKIEVIDIFDEKYPHLLKEISNPPLVLYLQGNTSVLNQPLFSIVGTRIPTLYGSSMARQFAYKLSGVGLGIVSGLARGIDTIVHREAIKEGKSIAVLGSGLLNLYPKENKNLAKAICEKGALISEFPITTPPLRENFPRRNRIISGLSCGVLVVEAAEKSGALITARFACEQNREVFALPGKVDSPLSCGTHILIKEGAKLVDSIQDILEELNMPVSRKKSAFTPNLNSQEEIILDRIDKENACLEIK